MQIWIPIYIGVIASGLISACSEFATGKRFLIKLLGILEGIIAFFLFLSGFYVIDRFQLTGDAVLILIYVFGALFSLVLGIIISLRFYHPEIRKDLLETEAKEKTSSVSMVLFPFLYLFNLIMVLILKIFGDVSIGWGWIIAYLFVSLFLIGGTLMGIGKIIYLFKQWFCTIPWYKEIQELVFGSIF